MITCRRGSAKRAKHSVTPTSRFCYLLTITIIGNKQQPSPQLQSCPLQSAYHPFDRTSPSILAVLIPSPPTNAPLPPSFHLPISRSSGAYTQHAAHPSYSFPRSIFRSPECNNAPRTHLRASFHRTNSSSLTARSHMSFYRGRMAWLRCPLFRDRVKGSAERMGFGT